MKTLLVKSTEGSAYPLVALLVRGDHELNEVKAEKLPQVASPLTFATEAEIRAVVNAGPVHWVQSICRCRLLLTARLLQ